MSRGLRLSALLALCVAVAACPDDEGHHHHDMHRREYPQVPLAPPTRPLQWGDVNVIHTTDSHGWLLGHQKLSEPEPNYSGDFGDFASFVSHMKLLALEKDVDLLLVDSGDLHDGTGISDGFPTGGIDAHDANKFIAELPYDVMAIGNHELYIYAITLDMHQSFAPKLNGRYLSSNVNITVPDKHGNPVSIPVGDRYAKFKTRKGRKVTSLGVIFDFTGNDKNTTVQKVEDMVTETWFKEVIEEEPDFFLLVGHMAIQKNKWPLVFNAIRAVHPTTPILIFGGHTHIRDCVQLDGRSMSLESGRYMETVGWLSMELDKKGSTGNLTFSRRYLDPNRVTYEWHSKRNNFTFDTAYGRSITKGLEQLAVDYDLNYVYGTAPQDYTISRAPYPANDSLITLLAKQVLPVALAINNTRADIPNLIIVNTGSLRFDVFAGAFTKNDQFTSSPFTNYFLYIPGIPAGVANAVLAELTKEGETRRRRDLELEAQRDAHGDVDHIYRAWLERMDSGHDAERRGTQNNTLGYVTSDACLGVGDDIPHTPLPFYSTPEYAASDPPAVSDDTLIDLVFDNFFEPQLLTVLNGVQSNKNYTTADVATYSPTLINAMFGQFAQAKWN